ncbi:hypothetical protein [Mucilaginibacter rigui]|uniref:hypothetical protein n=1 Tax=Mucilaginibacter rigui TaxID=534635 RepID=UPI0017462714|nr:hypothetical protein [Mucilaginibacter rigui]
MVFTDEAEAVYPSDALFKLKPKEEIYPTGGMDFAIPNLNSYKDLYKISLLQQMGRSTDIWNALQIARENPEIWKNSLVSVEESLGLHHNQYIGR